MTVTPSSGNMTGGINGTARWINFFNGETVSYTPGTPSNWNGTAPTTLQGAIDRLAALVKTLNSGTGA
jgi:hypothetical protein